MLLADALLSKAMAERRSSLGSERRAGWRSGDSKLYRHTRQRF